MCLLVEEVALELQAAVAATVAVALAVQCLPLPVLAGLALRDPAVEQRATVFGNVVGVEQSVEVEWQSSVTFALW